MPAPDAPPAAPFDIPEGLNPDAWPAFKRMIRQCGATAFRMPTSCELFLRQHLSGFDTERSLLQAALRAGVPERIAEHNSREGYADFLGGLAGDFAATAGVSRAEAKWAVEAWATAVGKPPGYVAPTPVARPIGLPYDGGRPSAPDATLKWVMTGIAAAGGFLGAALGTVITTAALWLSFGAVDAAFAEAEPGYADAGYMDPDDEFDDSPVVSGGAARTAAAKGPSADVLIGIVLVVAGTVNGAIGGLGAGLGWLFGRGNEKPWAGFAAAFAAAFGAGVLVSAFRIPFAAIGPGVAAFGATFAAASRGGHQI